MSAAEDLRASVFRLRNEFRLASELKTRGVHVEKHKAQ